LWRVIAWEYLLMMRQLGLIPDNLPADQLVAPTKD
jgi:hypothetical protein